MIVLCDGQRVPRTGRLAFIATGGRCKTNRLALTMPEQQVCVDGLVTTRPCR